MVGDQHRDDGPGIPEAELARLTARGARLDTSGPGAGLGLAIASEIAEAAGGTPGSDQRCPRARGDAASAGGAGPDLTDG